MVVGVSLRGEEPAQFVGGPRSDGLATVGLGGLPVDGVAGQGSGVALDPLPPHCRRQGLAEDRVEVSDGADRQPPGLFAPPVAGGEKLGVDGVERAGVKVPKPHRADAGEDVHPDHSPVGGDRRRRQGGLDGIEPLGEEVAQALVGGRSIAGGPGIRAEAVECLLCRLLRGEPSPSSLASLAPLALGVEARAEVDHERPGAVRFLSRCCAALSCHCFRPSARFFCFHSRSVFRRAHPLEQ